MIEWIKSPTRQFYAWDTDENCVTELCACYICDTEYRPATPSEIEQYEAT